MSPPIDAAASYLDQAPEFVSLTHSQLKLVTTANCTRAATLLVS